MAAFPCKYSVPISFQNGKKSEWEEDIFRKKVPMALVAWQPLPLPLCVKKNNILWSSTLKPVLKKKQEGTKRNARCRPGFMPNMRLQGARSNCRATVAHAIQPKETR